MKLHKLSCPNCEGVLDIDIKAQKHIFCPYCGQKFLVDDEKKEYTINKNINIKKNTTHTSRIINDADVIRAKAERNEKKYNWIALVIMFALLILIPLSFSFMDWIDDIKAQKAKESGLISAGSYEDYEGENYKAAVEQLETLGFENITTIDLNDSGIAIWKSDKVESISIDGDTTFYKSDYFESDIAIIIKYH